MMNDERLKWLMEYLRTLSLLKSTRVNEQTKVIEAIEQELGLSKGITISDNKTELTLTNNKMIFNNK